MISAFPSGDIIRAIKNKDSKEAISIIKELNEKFPVLLNGEECNNKNTILHDIVTYIDKPDSKTFKEILEVITIIDPKIVNLINSDDYTALHLAIVNNQAAICKILIPKMDLYALKYEGCYNYFTPSDLAKHMLPVRNLINKRIKELEN